MLKIKDNVDLKELEKYGFQSLKPMFNDYIRFTKPKENYFLLINFFTNEIAVYEGVFDNIINLICNIGDIKRIELQENYIKDLIQDGLVEKVQDE